MKLLQTTEAIDKAVELASIGKDSSVTTIGVMAVLCVILLGFTIAIWRSKVKREAEQLKQDKLNLEALVSANLIIEGLGGKVEANGEKVNQLNMLVNQVIGELRGKNNV